MNILFENPDWLVIEKPIGISTHGEWEGDLGVVEWLNLHLNLDTFWIYQLDQDTSGALILAKTRKASSRTVSIQETLASTKRYALVVSGKYAPPQQWTRQDRLNNEPSYTHFTLLKALPNDLYLVEAILSTGKRHQIRRHAALSGYAILGDSIYGGKPFARLCLHCIEISWPEIPERVMSALPPSIQSLLDGNHPSMAEPWVSVDRRYSSLDAITNSYRLVHRRELTGDFAIDKFGDFYCAWLYDKNDAQHCQHALDTFLTPYKLKGGVTKSMYRDPHHKSALCTTQVTGGHVPLHLTVEEHGLEYHVDLLSTEQTGFFLDQRDNRQIAASLSPGSRVANLFSYTCSFSVAAAQRSPEIVFSVDLSKSALREGIDNVNRNRRDQTTPHDQSVCKFVQDDVRKWLDRQCRQSPRRPFQLVICDPPTFGKSGNSAAFRVEKEWQPLAAHIRTLLGPQGKALFCCNRRSLSTEFLQNRLQCYFGKVVRHRTPFDFPEQVDDRHNRMFWCAQPRIDR